MDREVLLRPGERIDDLQQNGYRIIQHPEKFCFGLDAVLLAHFVRLKKGNSVLDLGTGTGILPILLCAFFPETSFTAMEIQAESADMARRSVELNGLQNRIHVAEADLKNAASLYGKKKFDAVVSNPPYMGAGCSLVSLAEPKAVARHEILCTLADVIGQASAVLQSKKSLFLVHRPTRLAEIFSLCARYRLEPKRMRFVQPMVKKEPNLVLLEAVKDANPELRVEPPIIVYESKNVYTKEILSLYGF